MSPAERLVEDAATLGVVLSLDGAGRLFRLLEELERWNRRFNLTAITEPEAMVTQHLLDSLSVSPDLVGTRIADAGTGAGFPGLPLAVANPQRQFTLIDSTSKKVRFVAHAAQLLQLANVTALAARVESLKDAAFDTVVARAFAPLPRLLEQVGPLCGPATRVLAMKGRLPEEELASLPPGWQLLSTRDIRIPRLTAQRCVIVLRRAG